MASRFIFCVLALGLSTGLAQDVQKKPNLLELAQELGLTDLVEILKSTKVDKVINHEGFFTIFAPTNDAFKNEMDYPGHTSDRSKMLFHVGRGKFYAKDLRNEMVVKSLLSKRNIRFNTYVNGQITANGRPIVSTDHQARNGVIHVISEVMSAVYERQGSVVSELSECCPQHSIFLDLVKDAKLYEKLDTRGPFTVLAPKNAAFNDLHPDFIIHLKKNVTALRNLIAGHVLPGTLYSPGLSDGMAVKTFRGNVVTVSISSNGHVAFDKATVTLPDVIAHNGAIHAVDKVMFPATLYASTFPSSPKEDAQPHTRGLKHLVDLCRDLGYTSYAQALVDTKMDKVIDHEGSFTVFAPKNEAFDNPANYEHDFSLEDRVKFHIGRGIVNQAKISNEETMHSLLSKRLIEFNVYHNDLVKGPLTYTANGRVVKFLDAQARNGLVHELESGMDFVYGRNGTLYNEISAIPRFSRFLEYVRGHTMVPPMADPAFKYTLLVPSNDVLAKMEATMNKKEIGNKITIDHFIPYTWYTSGMEKTDFVRSLGGKFLNITKDKQGRIVINGKVTIVKPDFTVVNGAFHEVDGIV